LHNQQLSDFEAGCLLAGLHCVLKTHFDDAAGASSRERLPFFCCKFSNLRCLKAKPRREQNVWDAIGGLDVLLAYFLLEISFLASATYFFHIWI
jgi:hypothetical protein